MEPTVHPFSDLFAQLGLPNDNASIRQFIATHSPLPDDMRLEEAPFWSPAQAQLLREERLDDADWAMVVDGLNVALHATPA
ncbi:DUF2789 domain-containing protein [Pseudoxanthomonas japonensis]|uniref:DUF2789 domain-containing protein n=1 Tax=Pseudoxanthomonas japonensis TaxID=69284 RepID=UPI000DB0C116|nr:DUF2789 domain-containing protein [Pseudoxanthomonas japonensis]PZQ32796.1 MAG: DUF2789 domain-containing protein [Stenotrophomonas acidaminiphila]